MIGPPIGSTPGGWRETRGYPREFPADLLREASHRLATISLVGAALWVLGPALARVAEAAVGNQRWRSPEPTDPVAIVSILGSLALYVFARRSKRDPRFILDLGLTYMVLVSAAVALLPHLGDLPAGWESTPAISWVGAIVLMFAGIIPSTPRKTLVAGLIAASMNPIAMLITRGRTWHGPKLDALLMHYPDYLLVGVSVVISLVVTRLGQQVARAREMGSYQLGDLLGRGGMGEVYKATHRMLARPAAIKLIRPEMIAALGGESAQLATRRFRREAEAAANLRSPHTVELYDFGVTEDETLYFVMELLEGLDLESLVRRYGPVPAARVIHILRQACDSLEEAHAAGLVHRDIKPANLHLGKLGLRYDFVKVLDFGLVKSVAGKGMEDTLGTAAGLTPGTPAYMAPEMAMGDAVDGRADIYALGCVGYYLLTGQPVFNADNALQMMAKHLREVPAPPSRRTDLPVPPELDRLMLACLAKAPEDRPQTAGDVNRALAAIDGAPWTQEQAREWWSYDPLPSPAGSGQLPPRAL
ncbi:MAG TPA: serine/threonine-protein kinase [Gemmatimonadales bacterium]|nr:serine/threonine-protein kinase [Gemmatimonadales bacterium]